MLSRDYILLFETNISYYEVERIGPSDKPPHQYKYWRLQQTHFSSNDYSV